VAGLLGMAKALAETRPAKTIRFAAFACEEPPAYRTRNMGSYHYAKSLHEAGDGVEGMICLEMIGYFNDAPGSQKYPIPFFKLRYPSQGNYISMVGNMRSRAFTRSIAAAFRRAVDLPVVTLNAPAIVIGIDFSDHWSFNRFRYNALMVTDTAFYRNPHYHAASDTPETLDYERMAKVVEGLNAAVEEWGGILDEDPATKEGRSRVGSSNRETTPKTLQGRHFDIRQFSLTFPVSIIFYSCYSRYSHNFPRGMI
jgi:Zn-dependent M28 family amino/carboxypeptidase